MKQFLILLSICVLFTCFVKVDGSDLDSLRNEISKLSGREKVDYLNNLARVTEDKNSTQKVIYANQALQLSEEISYSKGMIYALKFLGDDSIMSGDFENALKQFSKALSISKKLKDKRIIAEINFRIGELYFPIKKYSKSIDFFLDALNNYKYLRDDSKTVVTLSKIANCFAKKGSYEIAKDYYLEAIEGSLLNIESELEADLYFDFGSMYFNWGNLDKALSYHQKALTIRHENNINPQIVQSLNNIGIVYSAWKKLDVAANFFTKANNLSDQSGLSFGKANSLLNLANICQQKGNFDDALSKHEEALIIFVALGDVHGQLKTLMSYGNTYREMGKNYKALEYYKKVLSQSELLKDYKNIAVALYNIGVIYKNTNSITQAVIYFNRSIEIAAEINNKELLLNNYLRVSESKEKLGDLENALKYSRLYSVIKDSIISEVSMSRMAEVKSNLEIIKSKKEIESLQQNNLVQSLELESQSKQRNFLFFVTVIVILISSFIYYRFYIKSKTSEVIMGQKNKLDLLNMELNRKNTYLTESESKLKYLNNTKDKFFSIISHDLKNPFSTLMGYTDLLSEYFDDFSVEETKSIINEVQSSTHRAYALLENLLQWSKSQRGELKMLPERIDLAMIVSDNLTNLHEAAQKKDIKLTSELCEQTYALADYTTISSVVKNLLNNSIKFTNEGGNVKISAIDKGDLIEVVVSDNGVSISEEDIDKLFRIDVHHTSIGVTAEKGTGLGLVLCKEFIEKKWRPYLG